MNWKDKFPKENRYFETENGILYKGDCLEIMKEFPKWVFDAIITDPPYGVTQNNIDNKLPFDTMWNCLKKVRKDTTPIVLFGQGKFFFKLCLSNEKEYCYDLVWNKELVSWFLNANRMPLRQHEYIAVFYKKAGKYNPQKQVWKHNHSKWRWKDKKEIKTWNVDKMT